jgi:serine/threonine-protein kinase
MHKVLQVKPEPPSSINPALPRGFDDVVERALAKKADERFASAKDFQVALLQALQGKPISTGYSPDDPERTLPPGEAERVEATRTRVPAMARRQLSLSPEVVAELERSLSRHIGPLAKLLVKQGQSEAADMDDFCRILAENIPNAAEKSEFLAKVAVLKKKHAGPAPPTPAPGVSATRSAIAKVHKTRINFTPEALATAEKRLASYVGPLARVLIKDAVNKSGSLRELYTALAAHIDSDEERQAFLDLIDR